MVDDLELLFAQAINVFLTQPFFPQQASEYGDELGVAVVVLSINLSSLFGEVVVDSPDVIWNSQLVPLGA